jgi:anti-sigma regulatory factor (Ser/Thr protein kinase)
MKDLSLHVMDILQNSTRAGATKIELDIVENTNEDIYSLQFIDNGCGMDEETVQKVIDPFFTTRTVRKVGLGLPLIKQNAERTGGSFQIQSQPGKGTTVNVVFSHKNIDRPTLGDIAGTIVLTASAYPDIHFIYKHQKDGKEYIFDTDEVNEALDGVSIQDPEIIQYLREMITENLKEIGVEF